LLQIPRLCIKTTDQREQPQSHKFCSRKSRDSRIKDGTAVKCVRSSSLERGKHVHHNPQFMRNHGLSTLHAMIYALELIGEAQHREKRPQNRKLPFCFFFLPQRFTDLRDTNLFLVLAAVRYALCYAFLCDLSHV